MVRNAAATVVLAALAGGCGDDLHKARWYEPSARMHLRAWATESRFTYPFGWRDTTLDVVCALDARACAPRVAAYFADARCNELVVASHVELPPIAMYVDGGAGKGHGVRIDAPFAGVVYAAWRGCDLAGETESTFHYARAHTTPDVQVVDRQEADEGTRYAYPAPAFAALAGPEAIVAAEAIDRVAVEDGPGRLRTRYLGAIDDAYAAGILDTRLGVACTPGPDLAGDVRCLPRLLSPIYRDAFVDTACTQPVGALLYAAAGYAVEGAHYVQVDAPVAAVHVRAGDLCIPASVTAWRASAAVDATVFEPMHEVELAP